MKISVRNLLALTPIALSALSLQSCSSTTSSADTPVAAASTLSTQPAPHVRTPYMMPPQKLQQELGLSDAQVTRIVSIRKEFKAQLDEQFKTMNGDRGQMQQYMRLNRPKLESKISAVLTADQLNKLKALGEKMAKAPTPEEIAQRREAHLQQMKVKLNLTDDQVSKLRALDASRRPNFDLGHLGNGPDADVSPEARANAKQQMDARRAEFESKLSSILTPQQLALFNADRKNMRRASESVSRVQDQ